MLLPELPGTEQLSKGAGQSRRAQINGERLVHLGGRDGCWLWRTRAGGWAWALDQSGFRSRGAGKQTKMALITQLALKERRDNTASGEGFLVVVLVFIR